MAGLWVALLQSRARRLMSASRLSTAQPIGSVTPARLLEPSAPPGPSSSSPSPFTPRKSIATTSLKPLPAVHHQAAAAPPPPPPPPPPPNNAAVHKPLPETPRALAAADDPIAALQAQQDDLFTQRRNLQRLIRDLEDAEPENPFASGSGGSMGGIGAARRDKERRLLGLKEELDKLARLEYDVGLRLHRAWKRKERDDPDSGLSVLWVTRATSGE